MKTKDWIGVVSSIVTIGLFIFSEKQYAFYALIFVLLFIFVDSLFIIIPIFNVKRAENRILKKYFSSGKEIGEKLHKYQHKLRDYTSNMDGADDVRIWNHCCELLCDSMCDIFEKIFKDVLGAENISVCIKIVKASSLLDTDYKNWRLETFARSPSTVSDRFKNDENEVLISENSDFQVIIEEKYADNYLAIADMTDIEDVFLKKFKIEYRNSRGKDFLEYYRSCIIMPIEIDGTNVSEEVKKIMPNVHKRKLLLGFLCLDSMKVFQTEEEIEVFEMAVSVSKALGDSLYPFFEKLLLYQIRNR